MLSTVLCKFIVIVSVFYSCEANGFLSCKNATLWTFWIQVSNGTTGDFFGSLDIAISFRGTMDNFEMKYTIPPQFFLNGNEYTFHFEAPTRLEYLTRVDFRTSGAFCINDEASPALQYHKYRFGNDNDTFFFEDHNSAFADRCEKDKISAKIYPRLNTPVSNSCLFDNITFEEGAQFEVACIAKCICKETKLICEELCPKYPNIQRPNEICQEMFVPGKCCPILNCNGDLLQKDQTKALLKICQMNEKTEEEKLLVVLPDYGIPSALHVCDEKCSNESLAIALRLNEKWLLAYGIHIRNVSQDKVISTYDPFEHHFKITSILPSDNDDLVLLQVEKNFPSDVFTQPANLPLNEKHCRMLIEEGCPVVSVNFAPEACEVQELFEIEGNVTIVQSCLKTIDFKSDLCLTISTEKCIALKYDPIFVYDGLFKYLVGFQTNHSKSEDCQKDAHLMAYNLCNKLQWIRNSITI